MGRGISFKIDSDIDKIAEEFGKLAAGADRHVDAGLKEYGLLLEEAAKELAPQDTGDLVTSIQFSGLKTVGGERQGSVGSDLSYALAAHERPDTPGTRNKYDNGVKFERYYLNGRGRRTHRKAGFRGQKAGRKYLERAEPLISNDHLQIMEDILKNILGGRY